MDNMEEKKENLIQVDLRAKRKASSMNSGPIIL